MTLALLESWLRHRPRWIALLVGVHGAVILADTLVRQMHLEHSLAQLRDVDIVVDVPLLLGLLLLYLSLLLRRRKRNAWVFAVALYIFLLGLNTSALASAVRNAALNPHVAMLLLPAVMLVLLWSARKDFVVRSDLRTFTASLKTGLLVLSAAFLYGTVGFLLMEHRDFHQHISLLSAMHYTLDQFSLTTSPLHAFTRRASLFQGSLAFVSISAVGFVFISLFQPLRARYTHQKEQLEQARRLVYAASRDSEDFFKLWPLDKSYFLNSDGSALIAYRAQRRTALSVGGPIGEAPAVRRLLAQFEELCFVNDWQPAFIHVTAEQEKRLVKHGYESQLIGQEAVVEIKSFEETTAKDKYFRQIMNRFQKLGYTAEVLQPPHHAAIVDRLAAISDEWLQRPGRVERRFMMGNFSEAYMQQCAVIVARDAAGTIQAFLNLVPSPVEEEANFDLLRSSERAPGNVNDYVLLQLLGHLSPSETVQRLNLGLCPLAGIDDEPNTLINRTLRFVYSNGDRLYSFQGLYKFKAKYQPQWRDRYIVYKGGATGFTRVMQALTAAMKV